MLKCLKTLIRSSHPTQHPLHRWILHTGRQVGGRCAMLKKGEKKDCSAKGYQIEGFWHYLDEVAPVPPLPLQTQRDQVLLRHFSHEQMSTVNKKMRQRGIQHHLKEHNKHKLCCLQWTVRLSFAIWLIPRDLFQKDSGLFWEGKVGGG